jgi:signal transduction histidine kinase
MKRTYSVNSGKLFAKLNIEKLEKFNNFLREWWRGILLILVLLEFSFFYQSGLSPNENGQIIWITCYFLYFSTIKSLRLVYPKIYVLNSIRFIRIQLDLLFLTVLLFLEPTIPYHLLWIFYAMPLLAVITYFEDSKIIATVYIETCLIILFTTFTNPPIDRLSIITFIAKFAVLCLASMILQYLLYFIPRLSIATNLSETSIQLLISMSPSEIWQLLSDAAKGGIPNADSSVTYLLGGRNNHSLIGKSATNMDITTVINSPMIIGQGIIGNVLENRKAENISDIRKDPRIHSASQEFKEYRSLLVAPMYTGKKNLGTICVYGSRVGAFDDRDKHFLETLAAQGSLALANVELFENRARGRQQLSDILAASLEVDPSQSICAITKIIANIICKYSGYNVAVINLLDETNNSLVVDAIEGLPARGILKLHGKRIPLDSIGTLLVDDFRISQSYFIRHDRISSNINLEEFSFTLDMGERNPGEWHAEDILIVPIYGQNAKLIGYISVDDPTDKKLPSFDSVQVLEVLARVAGTAIQNAQLFNELQNKRNEADRTARLLHLLTRISATTQNIIDLERFLHTLLTSITSNDGLRFNRASIFSIDDYGNEFVGQIGIGQINEEDARSCWEKMVRNGLTIENYLTGIQAGCKIEWTDVNKCIRGLRIPIQSKNDDIFSQVFFDSQTKIVYPSSKPNLPKKYSEALQPTTGTIVTPLIAQNEVIGLLVCDNKFTDEKVEASIDLLTNFSAHIAAAIKTNRLIKEAKESSANVARDMAIITERERLKDDLHEAMGMLSTGVKWEAEIIQDELSKNNNVNVNIALNRLLSVFSYAYHSLGGILEDLRDPTLENDGLIAAFEKRASMIHEGKSITINNNLNNERLPPKIEGLLYRIGIEGMNNAIKYSGKFSNDDIMIIINVTKENDKVNLLIKDNGVGFDVDATLKNTSKFGLRRMKDKVGEAGGEWYMVSTPGFGTELSVIVPIQRQ